MVSILLVEDEVVEAMDLKNQLEALVILYLTLLPMARMLLVK